MNNYFNGYGYFDNNNSKAENSNAYNYKNTFDLKFVHCPLCSNQAHVKSTRNNKKMLRCDMCQALIFANGPHSQKHLLNLPEFREYY